MPERFTTPVGRLVQGDAFEPQLKDQTGAPRVIKTGPNAGQPNPTFYIGVAFAKNDPAWPAFHAILDRVARASWPQFFPQPGGPCVNPTFAWKIIDGDGFDKQGKANSGKEGFAGHWVVRFQSSFPPKVFHVGRYGPADQVTNKAELQRGYYVRVNGSTKSNENPQNPGLYVNVDMIEIAGFGPVIVSGPDAAEAFGGAPAALPPGASAIPLGTTVSAAPMAPGAAPAPAAPAPVIPAAPAPAAHVMTPAANGIAYEAYIAQGWTDALLIEKGMMQPPAPAAAAPPQPYTGYMATTPAAPPPAPAAPPPAPVAPVGRTMLPAANGVTYEAYIAQGWTDDLLRQHGMMA